MQKTQSRISHTWAPLSFDGTDKYLSVKIIWNHADQDLQHWMEAMVSFDHGSAFFAAGAVPNLNPDTEEL